jgi:hypothetical protein
LEHLRANGIGTWRKRFLLSLASSLQVAGQMSPAGRRAIEVAERFVAGQCGEAKRWAAFEAVGVQMDEAADLRTHGAD